MKGVRIGQAVDFMRVAAMRLQGLKHVSTAGNFARESRFALRMPAMHDRASVSWRWCVTGETRVRLVAAMKGVRIGQAVDFMRVAALRLQGLKHVSTAGNFARERISFCAAHAGHE